MRTAIILLLLLAAGSAIGTLIPQRPLTPLAVDQWIAKRGALAPLAERLGLFDVYGSWWFMTIYGLLLVSLVGCLVPRYRAFFKVIRSRPRLKSTLAGMSPYRSGVVAGPPERALGDAERLLRRRRFRVERSDGGIAGEKGHWREGGSLLFHTAVFALLIGVSVGKAFGFSAQVAVVEGDAFTETAVAYDSLSEGRFFGARHRGFRVALDAFDVSWHPNGVPRDFAAAVRVLDGDRPVRSEAIRVNSPLTHEDVRVYLLGWGWAPQIRVTQAGRVLHDGPVVFLEDGPGVVRGVVKAPGASPNQLGLEMWFFNDLAVTADDRPFNRSPEPRRPVVFYQEYRGDLRLDAPQSVYRLDKQSLAPARFAAVALGGSSSLADGVEVSFPELRQYAVFQVASDPGVKIMLAGAVMLLAGLMPALYSSRRRVWVRAETVGDAVRLEIAGQALQRAAAFEEEFEALVADLDRELTAHAGVADG